MKIQLKNKFFNNEMLFTLYLFIFTAIKPILLSSGNSTTILLMVSLLILIASLSNRKIKKINLVKFVGIVAITLAVLKFDMVIRPNSIQSTIPYNFLIYGIIPLFLLINIQDFKAVLMYYCIFSITVGCMYLQDPFYSYRWSSDYMQFGFLVMLPATVGAVTAVCVLKKRICCIFIGVFTIELLLFGNKGAFLAAAILGLIMYIMTTDKNKRSKKLVFLIIFGAIIVINLDSVFYLITKFSGKTGVYSYSLTTLNMILSRDNTEALSIRSSIWGNAWSTFLKAPILGHGTVYLEGSSNSVSGYAHNIVLDIMVSYGILGLIIFLWIFMKSLRFIIWTTDMYFRYTLILFFIISIIPLSFSLTFWKSSEFWVLIGLVMYRYKTGIKRRDMLYEKNIDTYV